MRIPGSARAAAVLFVVSLSACRLDGTPPGHDAGRTPDVSMQMPDDTGPMNHPDAGMPPTDTGPAPMDSAMNPRGLACTDAMMLTPGATLTNQDATHGGPASTACRPSAAPQRFYAMDIAPGATATVTVTPSGDWRAVLRVLTGCDATSCVVDDESATAGASVRVSVTNYESVVLHKIVTVSGTGAGVGGSFSIALEVMNGMPSDAGTGEDASVGTDASTGTDAGGSTCNIVRPLVLPTDTDMRPLATGGRAVYPIHITARTGLQVGARSGFYGAVRLAIRTDCDDASTELTSNSNWDLGNPRIRIGLEPGDYFLVVSNHVPGNISYTMFSSAFDPAPNMTCATAIAATDGTTLTHQNGNGGDIPLRGCVDTDVTPNVNPMLYYSVTVPAGEVLGVRVTPEGSGLVSIVAHDGCESTACVGGISRLGDRTFYYQNTTGAARSLIVKVGHNGFFDVHFTITPPPANAVCGGAVPVPASPFTIDAGLGIPASTACEPSLSERATFYSLAVPARTSVTVTLTNLDPSSFTPQAGVLASCGGACVAFNRG